MTILKPQRLLPGDLIGLVSPAGPVVPASKINRAVRYLESLGYRVKVGRFAAGRSGYLGGSDRQRLADLHGMFRDRRVKAVMALRGGYGTPRLLGSIDYRLVRANPKIVVGFSDVTALLLAFWTHCRLVTFHGPMPAVDMQGSMDGPTEAAFWGMITEPAPGAQLALPRAKPEVILRGRAEGRLLGGNLSIIASLAGTPAMPDFRSALLFIEDVGEEPYRIDRMLTQIRNGGYLRHLNGVLGGRFVDCRAASPWRSFTAADVLSRFARQIRVPFMADVPFGHQPRKLTIPVGIRARMSTQSGSIQLLESPVL